MEERRGNFYLVTGLIIGIALGLIYSWLINPIRYVDTAPDTLRPEFKDQYRSLIAQAYIANHDLGRAQGRLSILGDERPAYEIGAQAQRLLQSEGSRPEARALAELATDLVNAGEMAANQPEEVDLVGNQQLPTPTLNEDQMILTATPEPTQPPTPEATYTPRAQTVFNNSLAAPLQLLEREDVCTPGMGAGLLEVEVTGENGQPIPGVSLTITWNGGQEVFFTGLFPEIGEGYADFIMQPDVVYSLKAGEAGEEVRNLAIVECQQENGPAFEGGVRLVFGY